MSYSIARASLEYNCNVYYIDNDSTTDFYDNYLVGSCNDYETEIHTTYNLFGEDITFISALEFFYSSRAGMVARIHILTKKDNQDEINAKLEKLYNENPSEFAKFKEFIINTLIQPLINDFNENADIEYPNDYDENILYCNGKFYVELKDDFSAEEVEPLTLQLTMPNEDDIDFDFM